jgi:hypothetical protein
MSFLWSLAGIFLMIAFFNAWDILFDQPRPTWGRVLFNVVLSVLCTAVFLAWAVYTGVTPEKFRELTGVCVKDDHTPQAAPSTK